MIKDLVVTNIPKDEGSLKRVLHKLGDHSWCIDGMKEFINRDDVTLIWYSCAYESYFMGNKVTPNPNHKYVKYDDFVSER